MNVSRSWQGVCLTATLAPIIIASNNASSADLCKAVALRDVAAVEALTRYWRAGVMTTR